MENPLVSALREWFYHSLTVSNSRKPIKQKRKEMLDSASALWTIQSGDGGKNLARILSLLDSQEKDEFCACIFNCPLEPVPDESYGELQKMIGGIMHKHDNPVSSFEANPRA